MTRFRELVDERVFSFQIQWYNTGQSPYSNIIPVADPVWFSSSTMTDSTSNEVRVKPVTHTKVTWTPQPRLPYSVPSLNGYQERTVPDAPYSSVVSRVDAVSHLPYPSSGVLGGLADEAFLAFDEQVPQEIDVANFLLDFRELGSLIPALQENLFKTVGGGFLTYSFGWKPLLGDIEKLANLSKSVAERLKWLKDTRGKKVRLGYSSLINSSLIEALYPKSLANSREHRLQYVKQQFTASGTLYHELEGLDGMEGTLRGMIAALGLTNPSRVVWERIPFSFVADWLARTKHITEAYKFKPFTGSWQVSNVSHSVKQELSVEEYINNVYLTRHVGTFKVSRYSRGVGLPVSSAIFFGEEITPSQARLASALVAGAVR